MIIKDKNKFYVKENNGKRYYCRKIDNIEYSYPSVTTIISNQKENKFKSRSGCSPSMAMGTITHFRILKQYSKKLLSLPRDPVWNIPRSEVYGRINRCIQMWNELNLNISPIAIETTLFNKNPNYAGTLDMLAKIGCNNNLLDIHFKKELYLLDIKTGKPYDGHVVQAAGYWHALRRKPNVIFVYLDSIIDRNPEQKATIRIFSKDELEEGYNTFLDYYVEFEY